MLLKRSAEGHQYPCLQEPKHPSVVRLEETKYPSRQLRRLAEADGAAWSESVPESAPVRRRPLEDCRRAPPLPELPAQGDCLGCKLTFERVEVPVRAQLHGGPAYAPAHSRRTKAEVEVKPKCPFRLLLGRGHASGSQAETPGNASPVQYAARSRRPAAEVVETRWRAPGRRVTGTPAGLSCQVVAQSSPK